MKKCFLKILFLLFIILISSVYCFSQAIIVVSGQNIPRMKIPGIEFLIVYYDGLRTGYDKKTGKTVEEIPRSYYFEEFPPSGDEVPPLPPWKELEILNPAFGVYTLNIIGKESGIYDVEIFFQDRQSNSRLYEIAGILERDDEHKVELRYSPYKVEESTVIEKVDIMKLWKEAMTAKKLNLIPEKDLMKEIIKRVDNAKKYLNRKKRDLAKKELAELVGILNTEKDKYEIKNVEDVKKWLGEESIKYEEEKGTLHELVEDKRWFIWQNIREDRKQDYVKFTAIKILFTHTNLLLEGLK